MKFSWNKALDNFQSEEMNSWTFREFRNTFIALVVITCITIGIMHPEMLQGDNVTANSIYDGSSMIKTYELLEGSYYNSPIIKETQTSQGKGPIFMRSIATEGSIGFYYTKYSLTYDYFGRILKRKATSETFIQEAKDIEIRPGSRVKPGAYMYVKTYSRYGVDCKGCTGEKSGHGNFSVGVHYDYRYGVRQWDGSYKKGVTYEGYYIIASDPSIPLCTVVKIENHHFEGSGIKSGEPFYAIVLDRGGIIKGARIDLFIGMEKNMEIGYGKWKSASHKVKLTIVQMGKRGTNSKGQRGCIL